MTSNERSVLFVCTANRIRSVMAEAFLQQMVESSESSDQWRVSSAGTWAGHGLPPMPMAIRAMAQRGIDISNHESVSVDDVKLADYNLILVMEPGHKESMSWEFSEIADRIYLVSEMVGSTYGVEDPINGSYDDYVRTADNLLDMLNEGYARIEELAGA